MGGVDVGCGGGGCGVGGVGVGGADGDGVGGGGGGDCGEGGGGVVGEGGGEGGEGGVGDPARPPGTAGGGAMSGSAPGRPARITAAHTAALATALATVHADPERPVTKSGCYQRIGALMGITGGAAQDRLLAAGLAVTPRPRGTVPCSRCGTPTREVLAWATARAGECGRCQQRGRK